METLSGYVYILKSERNGTYCIGSAKNLDHRLVEHNSGEVKYTRNIRPLALMFAQKYDTLTKARKVEYKLKRLKSAKVIEQIIAEQSIKIKVPGV
ncbi:MAG: GIY-YIG nuclease family protein [Planctomycetes bacterium]|nr:GIY-YIG nuclease family protein [Planctomycetota bacterium]